MTLTASWRRVRISSLLLFVALLLVSGCTLSSGDGTETEISGPPVVTITTPANNAQYAEGATIILQATISNAGADIDRISITVDGTAVQTLSAPNPSGLVEFSVGLALPAPAIGPHSITLTVFRGDGSASNPATANFSVVDRASVVIERSEPQVVPTNTPEVSLTATSAPAPTSAQQAQPTSTPEPTTPAATATPSVPVAISVANINVRSGPGTVFEPPIGTFLQGEQAQILSFNTDGSWVKIRRGQTGEGWVFVNLVELAGDTSRIPREVGPPTPVLATNTPLPTATPSVTNNLVPINPFIDPPNPQCGQDFRAGITIRNDGTGNLNTGLTRIEVRRVADGQVIRSSGDALVAVNLPPGGTHTVAFTFNVDVFVNEQQRVVYIADVNKQVSETIETDNEIGVTFTLPACP